MPVLVDTAMLPADERVDAWAEANLKVFEPISVRARSRLPFSGRLVRHELGPLQLLRLSADASSARRTRKLIQASDPENVEVMLQLQGACGITQDGRHSLVSRGDIGCWHSSAPYVVEAQTRFDILIVTCPSALLSRDADRFRSRTATRIDGSAGVARLMRQHLTTLAEVLDADACSESARAHLSEGVFDLVRALHAQEHPSEPPLQPRTQQLRVEIDRYIDTHLARPDLSRGVIARDNFISPSYLDRLYADGEPGAWATVRAKRLDRVRRDLADPAMGDESIFNIASRWGFISPSHLSKAFRAAYGQSPSSYRESVAANANGAAAV